jgi:hypothetical protein
MKAIETQIGGDHYKDMGIQPLEAVLANYGYIGLEAAVYCKVLKYMGRDKGSKVENLQKASHVLQVLIEAAEAAKDTELSSYEEEEENWSDWITDLSIVRIEGAEVRCPFQVLMKGGDRVSDTIQPDEYPIDWNEVTAYRYRTSPFDVDALDDRDITQETTK